MDAFTTQCNCANAKDRELKHGGIARMQGIVRSNQSGGVDGWHVKTFRRCKKARNRNAKSTKLSQPMVHEDTQNLQDAGNLNVEVTKMSQWVVCNNDQNLQKARNRNVRSNRLSQWMACGKNEKLQNHMNRNAKSTKLSQPMMCVKTFRLYKMKGISMPKQPSRVNG